MNVHGIRAAWQEPYGARYIDDTVDASLENTSTCNKLSRPRLIGRSLTVSKYNPAPLSPSFCSDKGSMLLIPYGYARVRIVEYRDIDTLLAEAIIAARRRTDSGNPSQMFS